MFTYSRSACVCVRSVVLMIRQRDLPLDTHYGGTCVTLRHLRRPPEVYSYTYNMYIYIYIFVCVCVKRNALCRYTRTRRSCGKDKWTVISAVVPADDFGEGTGSNDEDSMDRCCPVFGIVYVFRFGLVRTCRM